MSNTLSKETIKKRIAIFLQVIVGIVVIVFFLSLYQSLANQSLTIESTRKDLTEQKDQVSGLTAQINSLNDKIKEYKKQSDALESSLGEQKDETASLKKNYDALSGKMTELNQEFDDKFGRLGKEIADVKLMVTPLKDSITAMSEDNKKWQKDYVSALSDLQSHVTRAAGLISQMRDEVNKKIEYISMVQEKMIKDATAAALAPVAVKPAVASDEVVHHQVLNGELSDFTDKATYQAQKTTK